jgi:hypothetical protein
MHLYPQSRIPLFLCLLLALPAALPLRAEQDNNLPAADAPAISIVKQDGFNLEVSEQITPTFAVVRVASPAHNWFAGTFENLPVGVPVTLGLSMAGKDGAVRADVGKWVGLRPLMTYGDPVQYETYEWFTRDDQGRWVSGDPLKQGNARYAGTGRLPLQTAVPAELAAQFVSPDGACWSPWREIDDTEERVSVNIFRLRQTFAAPTATVAMRIPYTYTYLQAFLTRLRAAKLPGVFVDELGETPGERKLQIIRLEDPQSTERSEMHRAVLVHAREHATEPAGSWVIQGMLGTLLADTPDAGALRRHKTWLFLPIMDPDGSADAAFDRLTEMFKCQWAKTPPEVLAYSRYFADYIAAGNSLDVVVNLHNVEANETPNIMCPFINFGAEQTTFAINRQYFDALREAGYQTGQPDRPWNFGFNTFRLYGRLSMHYKALGLTFEVNDRYPENRLSPPRVAEMGDLLLRQLAAWCVSPEGDERHRMILERLVQFRQKREAYLTAKKRGLAARNAHELITLGY